MLHQYRSQRFRWLTLGGRSVRVGTIPVGTIAYIQDGMRPIGGVRQPLVCRNPWIVESWQGHLATVRSLRDGRRRQVADWILLLCEERGLTKE
jgi:hypothetical protein